MSRQLVATLTTDSNGEATFTYTGTGIGKIGFDAKYGTFQSETYDVIDGILTVISEESLTNGARSYVTSPSDDGYDWECDFCVEFDVQAVSNPSNQRFRVYSKGGASINTYVNTLSGFGITDTNYHHLKIEVYENNLIYSLDGGTPVETSKTFDSKCRVNFTKYGDDTPSTNVKNFVIYPI